MNKVSLRQLFMLGVFAFVTSASAGTATQVMFQSKTLGKPMFYWVYLPNNYQEQVAAGKKFSVVYLLHQFSAWAAGWHIGDSYQPNPMVDKAIDSVQGIIAIAPDDGLRGGKSWWLDSPFDTLANKKEGQLSTYLKVDLKKEIDSIYKTETGRLFTGLCGTSMGGYGTLHNLRISSDVYSVGFAIVGGVYLSNWKYGFEVPVLLGAYNASVWNNYDIVPNAATYKNKNVKIRFYTTTTDFFRADNISLDSALTKNGVAHQFDTLSGSHQMPNAERMVMIMKYFQTSFPPFTPAPSQVRPGLSNAKTASNLRNILRVNTGTIANKGVLWAVSVDGRTKPLVNTKSVSVDIIRK